jgi:hypothetical protein
LQGAETNARAKSVVMIPDGERFEENFQKHAAILDDEQSDEGQKPTEFRQFGRDNFSARDERKETFLCRPRWDQAASR